MWKILILCGYLSGVFNSCKPKGTSDQKLPVKEDTVVADIDSIYLTLSKGRRVQTKGVVGSFSYDSTHKDGYTARFYSDEFHLPMRYVGYPDERKDVIFLRKQSFQIDSKFDPLSVTVFWVQPRNGQFYLVLYGKSQSASGSGNQVTYFCMVQLRKDTSIEKHFEFQSRFGTVNNIIDYNNDGEPDYFKIENSNKLGEYRLTIHHILDSANERTQFVLRKKSDDKFLIIDSSSTSK